ncbi:TetR/AcrR family transcriptional regulator [Mycobacterium sp. HNNTM2301]|uniref:TetR/AcrR family transcriptional regulator n=1 Tax=Mycobacterium hainanense TaxID=3289775 RepID=UPI0035A6EDBC
MVEHGSSCVKLIPMVPRGRRRGQRTDALSKERIVTVAIEILDTEGENALTFRALTARLGTGAGAIYWHVANKDDLLAAAADLVIAHAVTAGLDHTEPREAIRAIALGVFDALNAHPWVGTQLAREPWQSAMLHLFEGIGRQLQALGTPEHAQFNSATTLMSYIVGLAAQYAAGARLHLRETDRSAFLASVATQWTREHDAADYPFVHQQAMQLAEHDDRKLYLAGIDLILTGIETLQ